MYKILTILTVLVISAASLPAQAQNFGARNADANYTGPYLGITGGYSWTDVDVDATVGGVGISDSASVDGWQGGFLAGYGFQFGQGRWRETPRRCPYNLTIP